MSHHDEAHEPEKKHGDPTEDSAAAVSPDTQYADPTAGGGPVEPADTEDDEFAAGTADTRATGDTGDAGDEDAPGPQGTDADTLSDGPDKETGFYG